MFSRFDTIPECDGHPATQPASHVALAITLNAQASSLINQRNTKFNDGYYVLLCDYFRF